MFTEDELLPISALQHLVYCQRQCALIHIEGVWEDNVQTVSGALMHQRVDEAPGEIRAGVRIARGLPLRSLRLGLAGRADVVEFRPDPAGVRVEGLEGRWAAFPIEYKRGRPKAHRADEVQLCAQAICLEEMLATEVQVGALFYGAPRRRAEVRFDDVLRRLVESAAARLRLLVREGKTPAAEYGPKCDACSLIEVCRPKSMARSAACYLKRNLELAAGELESS